MMWEIYRERGKRPLCPKVAKQQAMLPGRRAGLGKHRHRAGGPMAESGRQPARGRAILCPCQGAHHPHFGEVHQAVLGVIGSALFNERQVREVHAQVRDARRVTTERQKRETQLAGQMQQGWFPKINTLYLLKKWFLRSLLHTARSGASQGLATHQLPLPAKDPRASLPIWEWGRGLLPATPQSPAGHVPGSCHSSIYVGRAVCRLPLCSPLLESAWRFCQAPAARAGQGPPGLQPAGGSSRGNLLFQSFPQVFKSSF